MAGDKGDSRFTPGEPEDFEDLPPAIERAEPKFGGYLYQARELLVTQDDLNLLRRELQRLRIRLVPGEPQPIGGTRLLRLFLHADERRTVPEVVSIMRAIDLEDRPGLEVFPNHVLVGAAKAKTWASSSSSLRPKPIGLPRPAGPLNASQEVHNPLPGTGVRVAVLDSGVVQAHQWLGARVQPLTPDSVERPQLDDGFLPTHAGHGTFIAGVILQCAPGASVVAQKVFGPNGFTTDMQLATALHAVPRDVEVINLSLGAVTHDNVGLPITDTVLQALFQRRPRPVVVAAAGNEGSTRQTYPAAIKKVIAVGGLDDTNQRACFSNHGSWVDACALGVNVHSTFFEDLDATLEPIPPSCAEGESTPGLQHFRGFATWSGTSFAAPRVAGAIAATMTQQGVDAVEAAFRLVYANGVPYYPTGDLGAIVAFTGGFD
jgi:hypothetical protein